MWKLKNVKFVFNKKLKQPSILYTLPPSKVNYALCWKMLSFYLNAMIFTSRCDSEWRMKISKLWADKMLYLSGDVRMYILSFHPF